VITYQLLSDTDMCMSSVNITSIYITSDKVIAEYNQMELSRLEAQTANSV